MASRVTFRHWLPFVTICPVSMLPDLLYVSVEMPMDKCEDLYDVRKRMKKVMGFGRIAFMEHFAEDLLAEFPSARAVEVRLAFNRHVVRIAR